MEQAGEYAGAYPTPAYVAKQYHPDANPDNPQAGERFKEISEAHSTLSNTDKRKKYDRMRKYGAFMGGGRQEGAHGYGGSSPGAAQDMDFDFGNLGNMGGLGDIFSSIFGKGKQQEPAAQNLETVLEVPFRVAMLGGKVPVTLPVTEDCHTCHGSGGAPGASFSTCNECQGRGSVSFGQAKLHSITLPEFSEICLVDCSKDQDLLLLLSS